ADVNNSPSQSSLNRPSQPLRNNGNNENTQLVSELPYPEFQKKFSSWANIKWD
ncbi:hypothetical protein PHET_05338, partial [Paragonimus heterotremus]